MIQAVLQTHRQLLDTYIVSADHDVATVVMAAYVLANRFGFSQVASSELATSVSELATNIVKYAGTGTVSFERLTRQPDTGLEVVVRDRGPGISDIELAMQEHSSSSGTLGLGLPGVQRMVDEFHIDSAPGMGTCITVRKWGSHAV